MALKRNERYVGRFANPTAAHPQGGFKNRTSPTAQDGSYLEADWANDLSAFPEAVMTAAGITPDGSIDTATSSQALNALNVLFATKAGSATQVFRVMQSDSDTNAAVPLGQLQFNVTNLNNSIAQRALTAGNSNQQFSVANATSNSQAVNLSQLNSGLAAKTNQADFMGGTNGNGVWYLLPNGMQICRFNIAVRAAGSDTWTYPRQFNSAPQCLYTVVAPSSDASKALWINGISGTSVTFYNPNTILVNINLVAIL